VKPLAVSPVQVPGKPFAVRQAQVGAAAQGAGRDAQPMLTWQTVDPGEMALVEEQSWVAAWQYDPPQASSPEGGVQLVASVVSTATSAAAQTVG
jgi:hypothetical protein